MNRNMFKRPRTVIWAGAVGVCVAGLPVLGQDTEDAPGDQVFRFGFDQKFAATDNIRLDPDSVGTTYYSDTTLSFGVITENGPNELDLLISGVGRVVNDPIIGSDADFRDPRADLNYEREGRNARLTLQANYFKPDLAFLDPLREEGFNEQDFFRGGGQREDIGGLARLELGLESPLGFNLEVGSQKRNYVDTVDPLLFPYERHNVAAGLIFRLSNVTDARIDWYEERYRAGDINSTDRDTRRFTLGLDHAFSPIDVIRFDFGHSKVTETADALPGFESNLSGPVFAVGYTRELKDGYVAADLDSILTAQGRQTTLQFGRALEFPTGGLVFSLGVSEGETFNPRPVGSISYESRGVRSAFNASLSRTASISDILSQATEQTQLDIGYSYEISPVSSFSVDFFYADISLVGIDSTGAARDRASFYASYSHNVTDDWDLVVGYEQRYFNPDDDEATKSSGLFFNLRRDFEAFR